MAGSTVGGLRKYDALWHAREAADLLNTSTTDLEVGQSSEQELRAELRDLSRDHALTSIALSLARRS